MVLIQFKLAMGDCCFLADLSMVEYALLWKNHPFNYHDLPSYSDHCSRFMLIGPCLDMASTLRACHVDAQVGARQHAAGVAMGNGQVSDDCRSRMPIYMGFFQ